MKEPALKIMFGVSLLLLAVLYFLLLDDTPIIAGGKSGYVCLAKSIAQGSGYRDIIFFNAPPHTIWPPVVPLILTPFFYLCGLNFYFLKMPNVILGLVALPLVYRYMKKEADRAIAFILMILTGLSANAIFYAHTTWSEAPYLFFSLFALIRLESYIAQKKAFSPNALTCLLLLLAAYFTRPIGVALFLGIMAYLILEQRKSNSPLAIKKVLYLTIPYVTALTAWGLRNAHIVRVTQSLTFSDFTNDPFALYQKPAQGIIDLALLTLKTVYATVFYIIPNIVTGLTFTHRNFIALLLSAVVFLGFGRKFIRRRSALDYYVIFFALIIFSLPRSALMGSRYFFPLTPFILYYFFLGAETLLYLLKIRMSPKNAAIYLVLPPLIIISNLCGTYLNRKLDLTEGAVARRDFLVMAEWIKNNTSPDAAFASMDPAAVYLFAERKSTPGIILLSGKLTDSFYALKKAYVIASPVLGDEKYTIKSINSKPDNLELVFTQNGNQVYRLREGGG